MKLLLLQTDIRWLAAEENRRRAGEMIAAALGEGGRNALTDGGKDAPAVDLIVLPEMFTTGFATDPAGAAEAALGDTFRWMQATAARTGAAVAGSVAVEEGGRYFNRFYFVRPDGSHDQYDKRHLFSMAGEHLRYTAGTERVVVRWRGWRILLQVCYDLRFPVFARNFADGGGRGALGDGGGGGDNNGGYDMALYVASWPTVRIHPWNTLLRARAIENVCYVAGVNRTGDDPFASYSGGTALVDFKGQTVAAAEGEQAIWCEADMDALAAFRAKFPSLNDADEFNVVISD